MGRLATAFTKRGFSLLEFLVALIILTLTGIALLNTVVFFLHRKVLETVKVHTADAALNLVAHSGKLSNCLKSAGHTDPCAELTSRCDSSVHCSTPNICSDNNTCVVCYTNPSNGRSIYYGFIADNATPTSYEVTLCWDYAGMEGNYTTVITLPRSF